MKIVQAQAIIEAYQPNLLQVIEAAGRTAWKSEDKMTDESADAFIRRILTQHKHESVVEHGSITVRFICDRGVSHELVRHRLAAYTQESTRYCNYSKDKFGNEVSFIDIRPHMIDTKHYNQWRDAMEEAEYQYLEMIKMGVKAQIARSVLPNSLKTEVVMTANPREWRHVFRLRCDNAAHPQMRELMIPLYREFCAKWPCLFEDLEPETMWVLCTYEDATEVESQAKAC